MSGAEPWMGSYRPHFVAPRDALGSRPMEPVIWLASSERMSPNRFSGADLCKDRGGLFAGFHREIGGKHVRRDLLLLIPHINRYGVVDGAHAKAAPHRELLRLAVGQHAGLIAVGTVVDILQRAGAGEHQRHVAVDHHARRHRLTVAGRRNGRNIAVFYLRQDEQAGKPLLCIELRRHIVGDVQPEPPG